MVKFPLIVYYKDNYKIIYENEFSNFIFTSDVEKIIEVDDFRKFIKGKHIVENEYAFKDIIHLQNKFRWLNA